MNLDKVKELLEEMRGINSNMEITLEAGGEKVVLRFSKGGKKSAVKTGYSIEDNINGEELDHDDFRDAKIYSEYVGRINYLVKRGDTVKKGDLLCKIEPFGREVRAEYDLNVLETFQYENDTIEGGDPLFMVDKLD